MMAASLRSTRRAAMAASAKSLQNINKIGIFNPGAREVNVSDASAALADAGLGEGPIYAKPARNRATQLLAPFEAQERHPGQLLGYEPPVEASEGASVMRSRTGRFETGAGNVWTRGAGRFLEPGRLVRVAPRRLAPERPRVGGPSGLGGRPVRQEQAQGILIAALAPGHR